MSIFRKLFGLDVADHLQKAQNYERAGKFGMARFELETCLDLIGVDSAAEREQINAELDALTAKEQVDAESRAEDALTAGDFRRARYFLNIALSKWQEGSGEHQRLMAKLNSLPEDLEAARLENEIETLLRADTGIDFVDRQRTLEFWKSGFPPYREEYYFKKALTSRLVLTQSEQVARSPNDPDACFNFGVTLAQLGLINKALEQIRHFVELRPDDRDGHYFLANLLADQGYDDEAIREFERAIQIDPDFLEGYFYLGEHYLNLGDEHRAERIFQHLVAHDKVSDLVEDARAKLREIKSKKATA
jgi:tetratricopeptide (TPR) repeat protein